MVTGSTHASHCATQPIYATVTDNHAQNSMPMITLTKIPSVNLKFPEFSGIKKSPEFVRFSRVVSTVSNELGKQTTNTKCHVQLHTVR